MIEEEMSPTIFEDITILDWPIKGASRGSLHGKAVLDIIV